MNYTVKTSLNYELPSLDYDEYVTPYNFSSLKNKWKSSTPFNHIVLDNFLTVETIEAVVDEFPKFESDDWWVYDNAIEVKKTLNSWEKFKPHTYRLFHYFNSRTFIDQLEILTGCRLYADCGLNGGGLHTHKRGGKLNTHLDYSIHPKLRLERKLNLIIYISPGWHESWGGKLGLWTHNAETNGPGELKQSITPVFNRAVLFDTTQNSWHGLPEPITCPEGVTRNSLAVYYMCDPHDGISERGKALFSPTREQADDPEILELIKKRASVSDASSVYKK